MNYCPRHGFLVGPGYRIPSDPTEVAIDGLPTIGCNRLRCARCGIPVRSTIGSPVSTAMLDAYYDMPELAACVASEPGTTPRRIYFCRCSQWSEGDAQALEDDDPESFRASPGVPWRCEGHPPMELPHELDGDVVRTQAELVALATRALHADGEDATWLLRLHGRLHAEDAAAIAGAATECLDAADPHVRARALRFFLHIEWDPARRRLLELLADKRMVEETAWRVLAPMIAEAGPARELARSEALAGRGCGALFAGLAAGDTEWFLSNSRQMARANPARAEELFDSFLQTPDSYSGEAWRNARDHVRVTIAEMITLDEAMERTSCPLVTWDCNEVYNVRLRLFATSANGAMLMKSGAIEPKELELWNTRARQRGGRVGASHTHSQVVWMFEDDDCGIWNKTRQLVRGDQRRLLLQGSYVATGDIRKITSFIDATPEAVHRGVRCTLASGREILIHEEHDDDPPVGPDFSGEAVEWESEWVWNLAGDLATWLGVPHTDRNGLQTNTRQLEARARVLELAAEVSQATGFEHHAPASCAFKSYDGENLSLRWVPEMGVLTLFLTEKDRTWEWVMKRGTQAEITGYLRHFITPRRLLARARGAY